MAATKLGIDGGIAPAGLTGTITAEIGLVTGVGQALSLSSNLQDARVTEMGIDGGIGNFAKNFTAKQRVLGLVTGTGAALPVTDPNDVAQTIGLVTGLGQAITVTPFVPATILSCASSRGTDILAASETLQINVDNSAGITGVTANGVACTLVQIITPTEVQCTVPLGISAAPGTTVDLVVNNGLASSPLSVLFEPPLGFTYTSFTVDYAGLDPDSPFAGDTDFSDLSNGDVCIYQSATTPDANSVSMDGLGEFTIGGTVTQLQTFDYYIYDASDGTNSSTIEQIEVYPGPVEAEIGLVIGTGAAQSVTSIVVVSGEIGLVTGTGSPQPVTDGSTVSAEIGLVTGVGAAQAVSGGVTQVVSIGQVFGSGQVFSVEDGSTPIAEIGLVTGLGVPLSVADATAVVQAIGLVIGSGQPQPVSIPSSLDGISDQLVALQATVDSLVVSVDSLAALATAQQILIDELHVRFDLDATTPNTYADDGSSIANSDFTLTKTDNGNGTFDITRS